MEKTGYFETSPGNKSSTRLQMFITMFFAFLVIGYQVYQNEIDLVLALVLLTASFAPKQIQNFSERLNKKP